MLNRRQTLKGLGALGASPFFLAPMFQANAARLKYDLKPIKIADGVWGLIGPNEVLTLQNGGAIANIGILDTTDGAVVIDTGPSRRYGEQLKELAEKLTGKPVVRALVTHFHPDHAFGNQAFDKKVLATSQGVVEDLKTGGEDLASAMYFLAGDWMRGTEVTLPETIIKDGTEQIGDRKLRYFDMAGHTETDVVIYDEKSGVLFAGDLIFLDRAATTPQANLPAWRKSLKRLEETAFKFAVPGHGPVESGVRGIEQTRDWLAMVEETIGNAFERGLVMTEAMAEPLPKWTENIALARYEFQRSVMHLYPPLEEKKWPRVDRS